MTKAASEAPSTALVLRSSSGLHRTLAQPRGA